MVEHGCSEKSRATILESSKHKRVPILVMMPVNTFGIDSSGSPRIRKIKALTISLRALKLAGVYGIAVEEWYSGKLICHVDAILSMAASVLKKYQQNKQNPVILVAKIAGIYWWCQTMSHPAELTAGYCNTALRDGNDPVATVLFVMELLCIFSVSKMIDGETQPACHCSPED
ncbi:hypothetical protein GH714_006767 [Hevea brasiliensis]|uniref:Beta-amylase n=1 Tax=Hevea brasiliensis TaxID=3981 RepID=A0A6A6LVS2_HEVBR|nr:hypothetical protein GH714_006767 [Hevea brasiliensis]